MKGWLQDRLAEAAYQCGAHARALQFYELHLREAKGNALNSMALPQPAFADGEVSFLQARTQACRAQRWAYARLGKGCQGAQQVYAAQASGLGRLDLTAAEEKSDSLPQRPDRLHGLCSCSIST